MSIMYNNKCIAGSYEDCANTDLSNLTDTGSKMMDGQWVAKTATLSTATAVGTYTIDLSDYLPNDNYNYEVYGTLSLTRYDTSSSNSDVGIVQNENDSWTYALVKQTVQGSTVSNDDTTIHNTFTCCINTKTVYYKIINKLLKSSYLVLIGYRRIGSNC